MNLNSLVKLTVLSDKNTLFVGKVLLHFPSLASTNVFAQELLSKTEPKEGTVIYTHTQTAGKGQIGSTWDSEPGQNLAMSTILYPRWLPIHQQYSLNQAVALAARDVAAQYTALPVYIKWPNDIYVHKAKTAGILIQNSLSGARIQSAIIGIGINVNQLVFAAYPTPATSLSLAAGRPLSLEQLLHDLCASMEQRYLLLRQGHYDRIAQEYLRHLYQYQQPAPYLRPDGQRFTGTITGVSPTGKLQMNVAGSAEEFDLKGLSFL